jgi:spore coat polysaccharide biosynthesis protein SpsF
MTTAILQARSNSTRLPGKVLKPLLGIPMVLRQIERLQHSSEINTIVLATSEEPTDDALAEVVLASGIPVVRGPLDDVLQRFVVAAELHPAEILVRLTADCPLADAPVIDDVIRLHKKQNNDYTSNTHPRTFARGLDVEVFSSKVLFRLNSWELSTDEREHVTMGIYRRPSEFSMGNLEQSPSTAEHRWTVDLPEDFEFVTKIYQELYTPEGFFWQQDILNLLDKRPDLVRLESDAEGH